MRVIGFTSGLILKIFLVASFFTVFITNTNAQSSKTGCSAYIIPYMPYSGSVSQLIYMTRVPKATVGNKGQDAGYDIEASAIAEDGTIYDLGVVGTSDMGNTKLSQTISDSLSVRGYTTGKLAIKLATLHSGNVSVYASYLVGTERGYLACECVK